MPRLTKLLAILTSFLLLTSCENAVRREKAVQKLSQLERIKTLGVLRVVTRFDRTTYYESPEGFTGLEYDLVRLFARRLGVTPKFIVPENFGDVLAQIVEGKADIAAASLTMTDARKRKMRFAPAHTEITEQVIYRSGRTAPKTAEDLADGILEVVQGSSHEETLEQLKERIPELEWNANPKLSSDSLLYLVNEGLIDYTIADSNQLELIQRFFPKLNVAFDISEPRQLAWAMTQSDDDSLYKETVAFFQEIKKNKTLDRLLDKHYGHTSAFGYVDNCTFRHHVKSRLPSYRQIFEAAAENYALDWRLLAAIGYQESHWNRHAVSPTGVRGLMMLTRGTASQLGVKDRQDPAQSIDGGARYLLRSKSRIPEQIHEPDRTWLSLAAYNVGYGHVEDARALTAKMGGNPDKWMDVKQYLPLLSKKRWYSKTKYGYARGSEPVRYVENIRNYYDLLVWLTEGNPIAKNLLRPLEKAPSMATPAQTHALLSFETPAI